MAGIRDQQYNKGEWAELYVFMKLLGDGRLYAADRQLRRRDDSYLDVQKIVREENKGVVTEYLPDGSGRIIIVRNGSSQAEVQSSDFLDNAVTFFDYLKESRGSSFPAPEGIAKFADSILVTKPKSPSVSRKGPFGGKSDIIMQMLDGRNAMISTMGFSIKSQFGQAPTLYNAGTSTQFLFEMCGMKVVSEKLV